MSTVTQPDPKQLTAMAAHAIIEQRETHDAMVSRIARDRLKAKIASLAPADIISGLHSVIERKHGALLRAAFSESAEAFGDALISIVVREMELQSEIEAFQIVERIEGEQPKARRVFKIIGDMS